MLLLVFIASLGACASVVCYKLYCILQQGMFIMRVTNMTCEEIVVALETRGPGFNSLVRIVVRLWKAMRPLVVQMYARHQ